jgi:hypothetical protein
MYAANANDLYIDADDNLYVDTDEGVKFRMAGTTLVAMGVDGSGASFLVGEGGNNQIRLQPGSAGRNFVIDGGTAQTFLATGARFAAEVEGGAGSDIGVYISGSQGSQNVSGSFGATLVAGDLVVSGAIYEQKPAVLSFYVTSNSDTLTASTEYNIFDEDNYSAFAKTDMIGASGVTYTQGTGIIVLRQNRPHMVTMTLDVTSTSTPGTATVSVEADTVAIYSKAIAVHGSVDPVERTVSFLVGGPTAVGGTKSLEFLITPTSGDKIIQAGTAISIYAI